MEKNSTTLTYTDLVMTNIRLINFILSCTGLGFNFLLIILLVSIGRRRCATYFLLLLMTICDFLYCTVYVSIVLTVDQYLNIINHQILCPLSFFLTPFTFTGSILLLLICLLHFVTNYVRKYETIFGQIGGRLSAVFILALIIIRSLLSTTSVELVTVDSEMSQIQYCTIHMNTTSLVVTVQRLNHIFTDVTDILVYFGWIIVLLVYFIRLIPCKKRCPSAQNEIRLSSIDKPLSSTSLVVFNNTGQNTVTLTTDSSPTTNLLNEETIITNKERHNDASLIIVSISFISILLYLPIMINKYETMYSIYRKRSWLTPEQQYFMQVIQQAAHLFCLSIRFLPYIIFDKRIHFFLSQIIGMKCVKTEQRRTLAKRRRYKVKQKYIFRCQCHRRQQVFEINDETNHLDS